MDVPDVRYARAGGVAIAYQVVGDGPHDLLFSPPLSDLFSVWLAPRTRLFLEELAREVRLIVLNPRGTGLSDRPRSVTLEDRMDDITAVLDAVGVGRPSLLGNSISASACALFAASYPERCDRLVLQQFSPRGLWSEEFPFGQTESWWLDWIRSIRSHHGEREFLEEQAREIDPAVMGSDDALEWFVWSRRLAVSPTAAAEWARVAMETDLLAVLDSIRVPTLVVHREPMRDVADFVVQRIPDARSFETESVLSADACSEIVEFIRGAPPSEVPSSVLATVLFTDLVDSTKRAATLGDRAWRDLLTTHHSEVRRELTRFRGAEVDTAGDGFFCRFDGPARAIACGRAIIAGARALDLDVRAGVHIGECELVGDKIAGIAVVTGARISSLAEPGEVLVSSTVKDLVAGSGFAFEERGEHELKGVPGTWRLYAVADG
jgi:class 3 adenylate cyclase